MSKSAALEKFLLTPPGRSLAREMMAWDRSLIAHSLRAAMVADRLADHLRLKLRDRETLVIASFLHDIGKLYWPKELLYKQNLTEYDRKLLHTHPEVGVKVVIKVWPGAPEEILTLIREHHERADGSGYPAGRCEDNLHPLSIYAAAVESLTAMTEPYDYRPNPMSLAEALIAMAHDHPAEVIEALSSIVVPRDWQVVTA